MLSRQFLGEPGARVPMIHLVRRGADRQFFIGLARAFAGALIFAMPLLMTMEMWQIGFYMEDGRLALLLLLSFPLLVGLSRYSGFKPTYLLRDDIADALVAILIGAVMSTAVLLLFEVIGPGISMRETVGKIALQTIPAAMGATLARGQLTGARSDDRDTLPEQEPGFAGELFLMAVGALFLGLNVAPTEEPVLLSYMMGPWHQIALAIVSVLLMHGFVYAVEFPGQPQTAEGATFLGLLLRYTVPGYVLVLAICIYLLWTFGRTSGLSLEEVLSAAVVLGFPSSIGAAAARLIL
jgi:putative integral membrane protein (TIGR02587 family)